MFGEPDEGMTGVRRIITIKGMTGQSNKSRMQKTSILFSWKKHSLV
jgi:hypothetical protein